MCVGACKHVFIYAWRPEVNFRCPSSGLSLPWFSRWSLILTWCSPFQLDWPPSPRGPLVSVTLALGLQVHASHNAQLFNVGLESSGPHVCSANTLPMRLPERCQKRHQAPQGHHRVLPESRKGHCSCCTFALVMPHSPLERLAAVAGSGWSPFAAKEGSWGEARQSRCRPNFVRSSLNASASLRK